MTTENEPIIDSTTSENVEKTANKNTENTPQTQEEALFDPNKLGILNDVSITVTIEIGRTQLKIKDLLNLTKDSIIDLNKLAGEPVDIYANGKLIAKGTIITANGKYCVRLSSIPDKNQPL
jgi:flagellar motor switch protein FliN